MTAWAAVHVTGSLVFVKPAVEGVQEIGSTVTETTITTQFTTYEVKNWARTSGLGAVKQTTNRRCHSRFGQQFTEQRVFL